MAGRITIRHAHPQRGNGGQWPEPRQPQPQPRRRPKPTMPPNPKRLGRYLITPRTARRPPAGLDKPAHRRNVAPWRRHLKRTATTETAAKITTIRGARGIETEDQPPPSTKKIKKIGSGGAATTAASVDTRLPRDSSLPPTRWGSQIKQNRVGLTVYHAEVYACKRQAANAVAMYAVIRRDTGLFSGDHRGDGAALYSKPSHLSTASMSAAPQPHTFCVSSCSRSSSGSR